jgi:hypothetical protein
MEGEGHLIRFDVDFGLTYEGFVLSDFHVLTIDSSMKNKPIFPLAQRAYREVFYQYK